MNRFFRLFILNICIIPATIAVAGAAAATCSRANLTRCLDSACAINIGTNPAARCQLCGDSSAGTAETGGMKNLSVGASAKYTLSDKELKTAPSDPGARYAWATGECIKKVAGCTPDDVTDTYDTLIEQSCRAAGINMDFAALTAAKKPKSRTVCETDVKLCITGEKRCGVNYTGCESDDVFNRNFSECVVENPGCDEYVLQCSMQRDKCVGHNGNMRTSIVALRDTAIKNRDTLLANIVNDYQSKRESALNAVRANCTDNAARDACIATVCATNMKNKCNPTHQFGAAEKSMAALICKFHETACSRVTK